MRTRLTNSNGFSLVEVTLALGIASIGLATVIGLLAVAMETSQRAAQMSVVESVLTAVAADLRSTLAASHSQEPAMSQQFSIPIPHAASNSTTISTIFLSETGAASASITAQSRYRLTLVFLPNEWSRTATQIHLKLTWPAETDPSSAPGNADLFLALDRNG